MRNCAEWHKRRPGRSTLWWKYAWSRKTCVRFLRVSGVPEAGPNRVLAFRCIKASPLFPFFLQAALPTQPLHTHLFSVPVTCSSFNVPYLWLFHLTWSFRNIYLFLSWSSPSLPPSPLSSWLQVHLHILWNMTSTYTDFPCKFCISQHLTILLPSRAEIYRRSGTLTCKQHNDQIICPTVFHCVGGSIVPKPGVLPRLITLNEVCTTSRRCKCT